MADSSSANAVTTTETTSTALPSEGVIQLQFPTIDLTSCVDSLASPSYQCSEASTIMPTNNEPHQALDESWVSFNTFDDSHDEDLQSETTDAESLVDLSSAHDTESVVEDEEDGHSENEIQTTAQHSMVSVHTTTPSADPSQNQHCEDVNFDSDTDQIITFRPSPDQHSSTWIQLEYTYDVPLDSSTSSGLSETAQRESLFMKVSTHRLSPTDKPFHIAYYGVGSARVSRDELLGKVGAALVTSAPAQDTSKCYNIFPTEFGPGSKPAFAELIPSQAQMIVDNITVLKHGPDQPRRIRFALTRGTILESNPTAHASDSGKAPWRPSLFVVHLCRDDLADDFYTAKQVIELAERHCWPVLVISQDSATGMYLPCSRDLNKESEVEMSDPSEIAKDPIDLDTFLRVDTEQLNRHIKFVIDTAEAKLQSVRPASYIFEYLRASMLRLCKTADEPTAHSEGYELKIVETLPTSKVEQSGPEGYMSGVFPTISKADYKRAVRDGLSSLGIMVLGILVVSVFQMVFQYGYGLLGFAAPTALISSNDQTATVTATSAMTTVVTIPTTTIHDKPVSNGLDQMLQRLMGTAESDEFPPSKDLSHEQVHIGAFDKTEDKPGHPDALDVALATFEKFLAKVVLELDAAHDLLNERSAMLRVRRREVRDRKREQMKDFQARVHRLSLEMRKRSREFSQQSFDGFAELLGQPQEKFSELLSRSQTFMSKSHRSGAKKINQLIRDQKVLLQKAQKQAEQLVEHVKKTTSTPAKEP